MSTSATFGYLCVIAGFLVIVASVVFVIKGKAVLSDTGAPNVVAWGKMKANLTSAVALFALGAAMIVVPFWRFQQEEASQQAALDSQPPTALLTGDISGPGERCPAAAGGQTRLRSDLRWQHCVVVSAARGSRVLFVDLYPGRRNRRRATVFRPKCRAWQRTPEDCSSGAGSANREPDPASDYRATNHSTTGYKQ